MLPYINQGLPWLRTAPTIPRRGRNNTKTGTAERAAQGGRVRTKAIVLIAAFLTFTTSGGLAAWAAGGSEVVGLRRLSEQEYRNSIADIFGKDIAVQGMFEPQVRMGG